MAQPKERSTRGKPSAEEEQLERAAGRRSTAVPDEARTDPARGVGEMDAAELDPNRPLSEDELLPRMRRAAEPLK